MPAFSVELIHLTQAISIRVFPLIDFALYHVVFFETATIFLSGIRFKRIKVIFVFS